MCVCVYVCSLIGILFMDVMSVFKFAVGRRNPVCEGIVGVSRLTLAGISWPIWYAPILHFTYYGLW